MSDGKHLKCFTNTELTLLEKSYAIDMTIVEENNATMKAEADDGRGLHNANKI
jgi:hypothetical protein